VDVEKTIEFILDQQAKAEIRWQKANERMDRLEKHQEKFDKRLEGVRKLVAAGLKMVNQVAASQKAAQAELSEIRVDIRELAAAQKRTDQRFDRLVDLLSRRNPNGHR